jgi:hypothetical protein
MELIQKKLFSRQEFRFNENTLSVYTKDLITGTKQWSVKLDEIGFRQDVRHLGIFKNGFIFSIFAITLCFVIINLSFFTFLVLLSIAMAPFFLGRTVGHYTYL